MPDAVQLSEVRAVLLMAARESVPSPLATTMPVPAPERLATVVWVVDVPRTI